MSSINSSPSQPIAFKAETRQLLNILIHSLYTEREIFLRELISNASDALTRLDFEMLTNREIADPDLSLNIKIKADKNNRTLTIIDTGIGMTAEELEKNLGTIAHSGAKAFIESYTKDNAKLSSIIGQFGVGFYSAFMVAEWIKVVSRSYQKPARPAAWFSDGSDVFMVMPDDKQERGTEVIIKLKEDAAEFLEDYRLREIIRKHSDFISYPIFVGDSTEQANRVTALWRQQPRAIEQKEYESFYQQLTLDFIPPITYTHMMVDAPVQMYALLFVPEIAEHNIFSTRKQDGLKLYSRNVLIQEYCTELLPEYLAFIQGVVDSEDLPLNVSRESFQANRIMANLKKLVTNKVIDMLDKLATEKPDQYIKFWSSAGRFIKQGVAIENSEPEKLHPLLRFHTNQQITGWSSLDEYVARIKPDQKDIFYVLGDDEQSIQFSPHLEILKKFDYDALLLTDPLDSFMLLRLSKYKEYPLINAANADLKLPTDETEAPSNEIGGEEPEVDFNELLARFKQELGERVQDVRLTDKLIDSPARLMDPQGTPNPEMQRVSRLLNKDYEVPKKVLELNKRHPIIIRLKSSPENDPLRTLVIQQIYEDALLIEGLHPDPASMIKRIQEIIRLALTSRESG